MTLSAQLIAVFEQLDERRQQLLLDFARTLAGPPAVKGEPGARLAQATGYFDPQSLDEIEAAINEGCERVDWGEWR